MLGSGGAVSEDVGVDAVSVFASVAAVAEVVAEQPSSFSLENVTHWSHSVTCTGSMPAGCNVVVHNAVVFAE